MSFLGLEGLHVFITGAAGGIGGQAVKSFLGMCCTESAFSVLGPDSSSDGFNNLVSSESSLGCAHDSLSISSHTAT